MKNPIYVTRPHLPPLEDFIPYLESIWRSETLTNNGPFHKQFEQALCEYLGVEHISLFTNGTIALLTALRTLEITGEVITTPYSFVATAHSLLWNAIEPVFCDIDPATCNIDPNRIEELITSRTTAILAVHCYGNPCAVEPIQQIADRHGLKVIYDAAHGFGVHYEGKGLQTFGDLSVLSFHATKVFNTFEGGAIVCPDKATKKHIDYLKNFGFENETSVSALGINGKMSEINAAFGLLQLKHIDNALAARAEIAERYDKAFESLAGLRTISIPDNVQWNQAYYPIFVDEARFPVSRDALYDLLRTHGIFGRRYFFPLISEFPMYSGLDSASPRHLPNAFSMSRQVLCLPIYPHLSQSDQSRIIDIVANAR